MSYATLQCTCEPSIHPSSSFQNKVFDRKYFVAVCWDEADAPAMTNHQSNCDQHFFTSRHHLLRTNPTHTFHKQLQPISTPSPTTFGAICGIFRPLYLPSSYLLCTNLIQPDWAWEKQIKPGRFYPDLTLELDHHREVLSSTSLTPLLSNLWLIFREAWWDEPDHELVIGYNCPRSHCTDFTKSFSPATGASLPQMGTEAKPEQSQGSKLASQGTERSLEGQKAKARPPDLSWCGLQFVGRTPWQTEGDASATLPTAAAAPTRTWVHTGR